MIETDQAKLEFSSGLSSGAVLPFALRFFEKTDLQVYVTSGGVATLLSQDVDYTIADSSSYEHGANVTLQIDPPSGAVVTVKRVLPVTQGLELPNHGKLPTESLETQLDHIVMVQQQQSEELERAFKVPIGGSATVIPDPERYADYAKYAGYANAAGSAGRAGYAESLDAGYVVNSAGHATKAAGLDQGVVVDSAGHATKAAGLDAGVIVDSAGHATKAGGLDADVVVDSATNAGTAGGLTNSAKNDIIGSAVQSASQLSGPYDGPFALKVYDDDEITSVGMASGYVVAGGSQYLISGFATTLPVDESDTVYLTLLSSGGSISSGLVTSPSGTSSDTVVVRIAENAGDPDERKQIQFGDIVTVPWGLGGGGGGMMFPNYGGLTTAVLMDVYSSGEPYSSTTNLDFNTTFYAMENGFLRISLKNANKTGCLRVDIGTSTIELADVRSSTDSSGIAGLTFPNIAIPSGVSFRVYDGINTGSTPPGDVLIKFDHSVSITALNNN